MKKALSLILSIVMIISTVACVDLSAYAGTANISNRAEWLSKLVEIFDMTVESDDYPDNYFSDLSENSKYYRDILVATEFGLVNVEAGDPVNPNGEITREFAAQTLNYCLGYTIDEDNALAGDYEYTFSDYEECLYPDDDQVAVNRGWFELDDYGYFGPDNIVTKQEISIMIEDAESSLADTQIDENYNSKYKFADYVVEIPNGTAVHINENDVVSIVNSPKVIRVGDTFVVYMNDMPILYLAKAVSVSGNVTTIITEEANEEKAVLSMDMQNSSLVDVSQFEPTEDFDAQYENSEMSKYSLTRSEISVPGKISLSGKVKFDEQSVDIKVSMENIVVDTKIDTNNNIYMAAVTFDSTVATTATLSFVKKTIDIGSIRVFGIGKIALQLEVELDGKVSLKQKYISQCGFYYSQKDGLRNLNSFTKKDFSLSLAVSGKMGIKLSFGVDAVILEASVYASIGINANLTCNIYSSGNSSVCYNIDAYMYFALGVEFSAGIGSFKIKLSNEWSIFTNKNSPVRISFHIENGEIKSNCTRGVGLKYISPNDTKFGSVFDNLGEENIGQNTSDFLYKIVDDNVIITGYIGSDTVINIPKYIDCHKVTEIYRSAFENNNDIIAVTIPNSVEEIGNYAFSGCANLIAITIPDSVISLGAYAFEECKNLQNVTLGVGITVVEEYTFSWCKELSDISLPKYLKKISNSAFEGCKNLESIVIPNSVKFIECCAFYGCSKLNSISIPKCVEEIETLAFFCCDSLENIIVEENNEYYSSQDGVLFNKNKTELIQYPNGNIRVAYAIPDGVLNICNDSFFGNDNLKSILIPKSVEKIYDSAFSQCDGLESVQIPANVKEIGDDVFWGCNSVSEFLVDENNKYYSSQDGVLFNKDKTLLIQYPIGNDRTTYVAPNTVNTIGESAFIFTNISNINLGNNVKSIGSDAFCCSDIKSVTIPDGVSEILTGTFDGCSKLTSITLPVSIKTVAYDAFNYCESLKDVYYRGTIAQWNSIINDSYRLANAVIHCSNGILNCLHTNSKLITTKATTSKNGSVVTKCTVCGAVKSKSTIYYPKTVTLSATSYTYDGKAKNPTVTVKDSAGKTVSSSNYTVSYNNNTYVGKAIVKVTFKGNYSGTISKTFTINPKNTSIASVTSQYKGFTVKLNKYTTQTTGYQIQYSTSSSFSSYKTVTLSNTTVSKTITGLPAKKKYYVRVRTYKTVGSTNYYSAWSSAKTVTTSSYPTTITLSSTSYTYDGKVKTPTVTVKNNGTKVSSKYYSVSYANGRKNVGTYKITIKFKSPYSGTVTKIFKIIPKNTSISSITTNSKGFMVTLKKYTTQTTGYQIQYSTNSSFSSAKTVNMKNTVTSKMITGLAGNKSYFVRVRTYKTEGSTNYYSAWSKAKTVTTKK